MNINITETLHNQFQTLPDMLKKFISESAWQVWTDTVANKYKLDDTQHEGLRQETTFVLFGMEPHSNFRANLVGELDVTYDQALKISFDMNARVFGPVLNILKGIPSDTGETETPAAQKTSQSPNPFIPNPNKAGVSYNGQSGQAETHSDHMLMDHAEMERVDGVHLHSQNVMPTPSVQPKTPFFGSRPRPQAENIIDQKLNKIFKPSNNPNPAPQNKPQGKQYGSNDPYREPLN